MCLPITQAQGLVPLRCLPRDSYSKHHFVSLLFPHHLLFLLVPQDYMKSRKESAMNLAWDLYAHVFRIIKKHLASDFEKLHLAAISPDLLAIHDLELAVPGTYIRTPSISLSSSLSIFTPIGPFFSFPYFSLRSDFFLFPPKFLDLRVFVILPFFLRSLGCVWFFFVPRKGF